MRTVQSFATVAILAIAVLPASAQPILSAKSGVIAGVEGKVLINDQEVQQSVTHFPQVSEGAVLRTEEGRVELMLPPGFMLRMGENGALKMIANRLIDTRVELEKGSAVVEVDQTKPDYNVAIVLKDGIVNLSKAGVYRFDSDPARFKVFHGLATVDIGGQSVMVATGKMLSLAGGSASAEKFDMEQTDALDNWSHRRSEAMAMANLSGAKYSNDNYSAPMGNTWIYNPYYDMYTYMPMMGTMCNPFYGLCFYSPMSAYRAYYGSGMFGFGYGFPFLGYGNGIYGNGYGYGYGGTSSGPTYTSMRTTGGAAPGVGRTGSAVSGGGLGRSGGSMGYGGGGGGGVSRGSGVSVGSGGLSTGGHAGSVGGGATGGGGGHR